MSSNVLRRGSSLVAGAMAAFVAALAGCSHSHYALELRPDGASLERTLTCWTEVDDSGDPKRISAAEFAVFDAIYPQRLAPPESARQIFQGKFGPELPADLGGSGTYLRHVTSLGVGYAYAERFRGTADIDSAIVARRLAADKIVDLLLGWFEAELGGEPGFDRLRTFVHEEFRKDLKNIGLHVWLSQVAANYQEQTAPEFLLRGGQLLIDRGYLRLTDLPELSRAFKQQDPARLSTFIARLLARKMGIADEAPLPDKLVALSGAPQIQASLDRYLRTTDEFAAKQAAWKKVRQQHPDAPPPDPFEVISDAMKAGLVDLKLFSHPDQLEVRLHCGLEPFQTNGQWDEAMGQVTWKKQTDPNDPWSPFCFAMWSEPAAELQQRLFGKVALSGQSLAEYAVWHAGLDEAERVEWETFIAGLRPGEELAGRLREFQFSGLGGGEVQLSDVPRRLLLAGLEDSTETE